VVASPKGGTGKTTVSLNLVTAARLGGLDASGVDLDGQRSLAGWAATRTAERHEPAVRVVTGRIAAWREALDAAPASVQIVDTAPGVDDPDQLTGLLELARSADLVLMPTLPHGPSVRKVAEFGAALARRQGLDLWFVLNGTIAGRGVLAEARAYLRAHGPLCEIELPLRDDVHRAADLGLAVVEHKRLGGYEPFARLWAFAADRLGLAVEAAA
jgi:chromosome partitioning protein